jgi:hypothetical protein
LFVGDETAIEHLPPPVLARTRPKWLVPAIAAVIVFVLLVVLVARC